MPEGHARLIMHEIRRLCPTRTLATDVAPNDTPRRSLQPRQLFSPGIPSSYQSPPDLVVPKSEPPDKSNYPLYIPPLEKHLNSVLSEVEVKQTEVDNLKERIDAVMSTQNDTFGKTVCSVCHQLSV